MTCLVTLFDRKFQFFQNSPKLIIFGIFTELLSTQNVNVARFTRDVECDFFCNVQRPWACLRSWNSLYERGTKGKNPPKKKKIYWHYCIYFDISRTVAVTRKFSSIAGELSKSRGKTAPTDPLPARFGKEILTSSKSLMHNSRKSLIYKTTIASNRQQQP